MAIPTRFAEGRALRRAIAIPQLFKFSLVERLVIDFEILSDLGLEFGWLWNLPKKLSQFVNLVPFIFYFISKLLGWPKFIARVIVGFLLVCDNFLQQEFVEPVAISEELPLPQQVFVLLQSFNLVQVEEPLKFVVGSMKLSIFLFKLISFRLRWWLLLLDWKITILRNKAFQMGIQLLCVLRLEFVHKLV